MSNRTTRNSTVNGGVKQVAQSGVDRKMVKWTSVVAIFTGFLVIASLATNFFIYKQWQSSIDAQADTREPLKAVVAQSGVNVIPANFQDGKPTAYAFFFLFQNLGGTRTEKFNCWASIHYFPGSVPNSHDFSKPYDKIDTNNMIIPAGGAIQLSPVALSSSEVENLRSNAGVAVVWGHAEWSDIFHPQATHSIEFCQYITPQVVQGGVAGFKTSPVKGDCNRST
jgi:hypothetical protein